LPAEHLAVDHTSTNAPGTPIALYLVALGMEKKEFVRSIAFTFLVVKGVQLVSLGW